LGGLLGVGIAFLREQLDNTVKNRENLELLTGAGVVGIVPFDKNRRDNPAIVFETDNSVAAESFRKLRTNLQFLSVDHPPRLIVITSSVPNEGKSTTSINVALAIAEAGSNVLLVDGDMRRPSLNKYLDIVGSVGFSTVLSGGASLDEALQESRFPRLTVLAAGAAPPNPSELLGSLAAKKTLDELRTRFDYVIVDSPPLLAVTDSAILAAEADGALLLVRAEKTKRDQIAHAVGMLHDVGATLLGTVLTMAMPRGSVAYRYNYYYQYGSYGENTPGSRAELPTKTATDAEHEGKAAKA
jgi:receptor protein-tyrosine kinase